MIRSLEALFIISEKAVNFPQALCLAFLAKIKRDGGKKIIMGNETCIRSHFMCTQFVFGILLHLCV